MSNSRPLPQPWSFAATAVWLGVNTGVLFGLFWWLAYVATQKTTFSETVPDGIVACVVLGAFFGTLSAFGFHGEAATVDASDAGDFVARLTAAAAEIRYKPATRLAGFLVLRPTGWLWIGPNIFRIWVQLQGDRALLVGPKL